MTFPALFAAGVPHLLPEPSAPDGPCVARPTHQPNTGGAVTLMDVKRWERKCKLAQHAPVRIECDLAAPFCGEQPWLHLDALLTHAALHLAHYPGAHHSVSPTAADSGLKDITLPLAVHAPTGVWMASCLWLPAGHPRARQSTTGVTRQQSREVTIWPATTMTAYAVGEPGLLRSLLDRIPSVGKKRSQGYGRVAAWRIFPDESAHTRAHVTPDGRAARPLPFKDGALCGVRPPYWHPSRWVPALEPGERIPTC